MEKGTHEANLGAAFVRARNVIVDRCRKYVGALRVNHFHTGSVCFQYFLLGLEVLPHRSSIVLSGNGAPIIVPDKSLGNGLVFKMAVAVNFWTWLSHFAWHRYGFKEVHEAWP